MTSAEGAETTASMSGPKVRCSLTTPESLYAAPSPVALKVSRRNIHLCPSVRAPRMTFLLNKKIKV
jgi:hypothetical protein